MSYLVLARKFRPQTFSSIIGQEHITNALATAIIRNRVPHALLFTGPRGVGKTTAARVFARAVNCTGRSVSASTTPNPTEEEQARSQLEPCGTCTNCQEIAKSTSVAVWEIDGASNNSVDNVRELIDSLRSAPPPGSRYKVYIIDEVHMLSTAAFNALLKSLEEPPPNTIFIFATTEPHKIPETVISRCQQHDFRRLSTTAIAMQLREIAEKEGVNVADDVIDFLARRAQGGMRDAQSMFDRLLAFSKDSLDLPFVEKVFGIVDRQFFFSLAEAIHAQNAQQCFLLLDNAFRESLDVRTFFGDLLSFWRSLLVVSHCLNKSPGGETRDEMLCRELLEVGVPEFEELKVFASKWSSFDLQRHFEIVEKTVEKALLSNYPRFVLEAGVAKMASLASLLPLAEILKRLTNGSGVYEAGVSSPVEAQKKTQQPKINHTIKQANPEARTIGSTVDQPKPPVAEPKGDFNPSWQDFVHHVQSRSHVVLATYLRRVSPQHFSPGDLKMKAGSFDLSGLRDSNTLQTIKDCLYSYSGVAHWNIAFSEAELSPTERPASTVPAHHAIEGSIAQQEARAENERVVRIEKEVRSHPLVQTALSTFAGSKIEKVTVPKKS